MFYYYATILENTINFEREATTEEFNLLEPHISKVSKMLVDKRRINIRTVVSDSGASLGLLISKSGFQSGAIEAAKYSNIQFRIYIQESVKVCVRASATARASDLQREQH